MDHLPAERNSAGGINADLRALGKPVGVMDFEGLDTIPLADHGDTVRMTYITMVCDEVTALCPVTGQPDLYTVTIKVMQHNWDDRLSHSIESKSLKLYLQSFRDKGIFAEDLATQIAADLQALGKFSGVVIVAQKSRGGIEITSEATFYAPVTAQVRRGLRNKEDEEKAAPDGE